MTIFPRCYKVYHDIASGRCRLRQNRPTSMRARLCMEHYRPSMMIGNHFSPGRPRLSMIGNHYASKVYRDIESWKEIFKGVKLY